MSKIDTYKDDLNKLISLGNDLYLKLILETRPAVLSEQKKKKPEEFKRIEKEIPQFSGRYQEWYSESYELIRQLLPSRLSDFEEYYKGNGKPRKDITYANYTIRDALNGLQITRGWEKEVVVDSSAAIQTLAQQVKILESVGKKFESTLFDIKTLVHAELLDNELDEARMLQKNGYLRAAGALAGVSLEAHLKTVCVSHGITPKNNWNLSNYNDALKDEAYDTAEWRRLQHLTDLRNKSDHKKSTEPTESEITDLIDGTSRVIKNIF